ncbi:hypothetical protein SLE2022_100000 [Rubroshorea leprosula]
MDTEEDFELFSPPEDEPSSPVPDRKLKGLKKGGMVKGNPLTPEAIDFEKSEGQGFQDPRSGSRSAIESFDDEDESGSSSDGLGMEEIELGSEPSGAKKALDFESFPVEDDRNSGDQGQEMEIGDSKEEESENKQVDADESKEEKNKKRKKRIKDTDEMLETAATTKKLTQKERRQHLTLLRAESQRLLRETRDASFKPAPLVQKPISSLLQKIRQRKLEVSKKTSIVDVDDDPPSKEVLLELESEDIVVEGREGGIAGLNILEVSCADRPENVANHSSHVDIPPEMAVDEAPKQAFRPPVADTEDLFSESQTSDSKDEHPNSPVEVLAPSVLAMNLKFDSAPPDDISSDEEENDKENIDPCPHKSVDMSSPSGDPVKAFVDEEAEEEDDSDNDRLCFGDNDDDEDEDSEDPEELEDMIATEYEEKETDIEKRMEHHQELLNKQDAAETENMLQRWGLKQRETLLEEELNGESEEDMEESDDEASDDLPETNSIRMSIRKLREMIPQMFKDKDDVYISSDDEEMEKSLVKQHQFEKADKQAKLLPPTEDAISKAFFSHIKQVNNMPQPRKKAKISSAFSTTLLTGGKGNVSSKTSFIGRGSKSSLPPIQKQGSSMARSFIFEREVSNSRSRISMAEDSPDKIQIAKTRPAKPTSAKFSNSQVTPTAQSKKPAAETSSRTPLLDILRRSSLQLQSSSHCTRNSSIDSPGSIFAAFKIEKKTIQNKSNASIRTF